MNVLIFGGTGFVGRNLTEELAANGYKVCVVTRNYKKNIKPFGNKVQLIQWDNISPLSSIYEIQQVDVVINLSGESIGNSRWTKSKKEKILASRIKTTSAIVAAINNDFIKPKVFINASAVGYYGPCGDEEITESDEVGQDFLAQVCRNWENEVYKVKNITRVVTIRIGVVLGSEGALNRMALPYKFYLGGPIGKGNQWLSWIHIQDLVRMIMFIIQHQEIVGAVNAVAPEPVRNKDFNKLLGEVLNRPSWLPVPEFLIKIVLGQMAEMLLHGQRVFPQKITNNGFEFSFPKLKSALDNALRSRNNL